MVISRNSQGIPVHEANRHLIAEQAKIFKALGHPSRLLMASALKDGEKCVCDLQRLIGDDMSTVSKHLSILKEAGVVLTDKRGTNVYYRLALPCLNSFLNCTSELIEKRISAQLAMLKT